MKKIIVLGDIHGRSFWKLIKERESWDRFIFIGDYFDSFDISGEEQIRNFQEIAQFKEENPEKVVLLIGNHDGYINDDFRQINTSGYQAGLAPTIKHLLNSHKDKLQMAHYENNILFTHAGVGETWIRNCIEEGCVPLDYPKYTAKAISEFVNDVWEYKLGLFAFNGWRDSSGDEIGQTPIWIRPRALLQDTKNIRKANIIQIVGHTKVQKIDIKGSEKNIGGQLFLIDALGGSGEYFIIKETKSKISMEVGKI